MFYVLLDNYDEGYDLREFETTDELLDFFRDKGYGDHNWKSAEKVIVGKEIEWAELKKAVNNA